MIKKNIKGTCGIWSVDETITPKGFRDIVPRTGKNIEKVEAVKKKHLTALLFSCIVAKVMFDGKDCRTQYAV